MKDTMTPVERWTAVLKRQKPDRIPMDYWGTPEVTQKLMKHLSCGDERQVFEKLHIDRPFYMLAEYKGPKTEKGYDVFGCKYRDVDYGTGVYGECCRNPLAQYKSVDEIKKNYKFPDPDWWDYSGIKAEADRASGYPIIAGNSEPMLMYKNLRGQEQGFIDLIENPEIVSYVIGKLVDLSYTNALRLFEQIPGRVLVTYVAEDMGSQEDLMYSPNQIREFLFPGMKKMTGLARQAGAFVFHHNDGAIRKIIPGLIEVGIDILNPVQWRCGGMERKGLKKDFGDKLIFHGGVDNQFTLPCGTKQQVIDETKENIDILGAGGGYILAPCHNIQPVTPVENILAMYETGYEYGRK